MHWLDRLAAVLMTALRSDIFPDGWGELPPPSAGLHPIDVEWRLLGRKRSVDVLEGTFASPAPLPASTEPGRVRWYRPAGARGVCLFLAASNEEGYKRRAALARRLAPEGIGSLILENPFYGTRRVRDSSPPIRTVGELLTMGSAAVQEAHGLLLGFDGLALGVSGYSMGGNIAALVAATHPGPLVAVPMAPSPSPAVVFTEGLLSRFVDWKALGSSPSDLAAVLDRASVLALPPPVRSDLAIIVATRGDGYIPAHAAEAIHRHWEGSELRWETGGHLSMATMARTHLSQAVVDGFNRAG